MPSTIRLSGPGDAVISSAVLHFARDRIYFERMMDEMWRVLAAGVAGTAAVATVAAFGCGGKSSSSPTPAAGRPS